MPRRRSNSACSGFSPGHVRAFVNAELVGRRWTHAPGGYRSLSVGVRNTDRYPGGPALSELLNRHKASVSGVRSR